MIISIIGVLASLIILQVTSSQIRARNARARSDLTQMAQVIESFRTDHGEAVYKAIGPNSDNGGDCLAYTTETNHFTELFSATADFYSVSVKSTAGQGYIYCYRTTDVQSTNPSQSPFHRELTGGLTGYLLTTTLNPSPDGSNIAYVNNGNLGSGSTTSSPVAVLPGQNITLPTDSGNGSGNNPGGGTPNNPGQTYPLSGPYTSSSYIDPLLKNQLSFYAQPWRGYLQTRPASSFLSGIGINLNLPNQIYGSANQSIADQDYQLMEDSGITEGRVDLGWGAFGFDDQLTPAYLSIYTAELKEMKAHNMKPLILLDANDGGPSPYLNLATTTVFANSPKPKVNADLTLVNTADIGATSLVISDPNHLIDPVNYGTNTVGLSYVNRLPMAGIIFTSISPNTPKPGQVTVSLSKALPVQLCAGYDFMVTSANSCSSYHPTFVTPITFLKYAPNYPVTDPHFTDPTIGTRAGWNRYIQGVASLMNSIGISDYSVEIWNELGFGAAYTDIKNYYDKNQPVYQAAAALSYDDYNPGNATLDVINPSRFNCSLNNHKGYTLDGPDWVTANDTTTYFKSKPYGATVKVIWGYSNTSILHTPAGCLPLGTDTKSYHPYGTGPDPLGQECNLFNTAVQGFYKGSYGQGYAPVFPGYADASDPNSAWCKAGGTGTAPVTTGDQALIYNAPEGVNASSSMTVDNLMKIVDPSPPAGMTDLSLMVNGKRVSSMQSEDGADYAYAATKLGLNLSDAQLSDIQRKATLRMYTFWIGKGMDSIDIYAAYSSAGSNHFGIMTTPPLGSNGKVDISKFTYDGLNSPTLQAMAHMTSRFRSGVQTMTQSETRQLSVDSQVYSYGDNQPNIFDGDATHPALAMREALTILPFQVNSHRFVVPIYVMTKNVLNPLGNMGFTFTLRGLQNAGHNLSVSYYDPVQDKQVTLDAISQDDTSVTVSLPASDYPRLLEIQEGA